MSLAAARPLISVYTEKSEPGGVTVCLPAVFRFVRLSWMKVEFNENNKRILFDPICTFMMTRWTPQGSSEAGHSVDDPQWGGQEQEAALLCQRARWTSGTKCALSLAVANNSIPDKCWVLGHWSRCSQDPKGEGRWHPQVWTWIFVCNCDETLVVDPWSLRLQTWTPNSLSD